MANARAKRNAATKKGSSAKPKRRGSSPAKKSAAQARPVQPLQPRTKTEACIALLTRDEGATLEELQLLTGWQAHSVRGYLAGTVKKIPGSSLTSEKPGDGPRRYHLRLQT